MMQIFARPWPCETVAFQNLLDRLGRAILLRILVLTS